MTPYKDIQFVKFSAYGFLKNLRFFDPFFILFLREVGLTFLQIGTLYSIREVVINLTEVPTGFVADYISRRLSMVLSFLFYILSFTIFYFWGNIFLLAALAMVMFGLGETFRSGTHKAMILQYLEYKGWKELKHEYYGKTRSWSQRGAALSSLLAAGLVFHQGSYRSVFLFSIIPYVLDLLLILTYPAIVDRKKESHTISVGTFFRSMGKDMVYFLTHTITRKVLLNTATVNTAFKVGKDYLQVLIKNWILIVPVLANLPTVQKTAIFLGVVYFGLYLLGAYFSGRSVVITRKIGSEYTALNYLYIISVGIFVLIGVTVKFTWYLPAAILFIGLFIIQNIQEPILVTSLSALTLDGKNASLLSIQEQIRAIQTALVAPFLGWMVDQFGLEGGFFLTGILFLLIFPFIRFHREK